MENDIKAATVKLRTISGESLIKASKDDSPEQDTAHATQDTDCDKVLKIFAKMIHELHIFDSKQKKKQVGVQKPKQVAKSVRQMSPSGRRNTPAKPEKPVFNNIGDHRGLPKDGTTSDKNVIDRIPRLPQTNLGMVNTTPSMQTYQGAQNADPRSFLRENSEPNSQLPYIISKYIFKNKTNRKWLLKDEMKNLSSVCSNSTSTQNTQKNVESNANKANEVASAQFNQFPSMGQGKNYSSMYNMGTNIGSQTSYNQLNPIAVQTTNNSSLGHSNMQNGINSINAQILKQPVNFNHSGVTNQLPGLRNILPGNEVSVKLLMVENQFER